MLIDLSIPLATDTPVYPGDPVPVITQLAEVTRDGCQLHSFTFGTHLGTHIDAPAHMLQNAPSLGEVSLDTFVGEAVSVTAQAGASMLDALQATDISAGAIVLFNTGTYHRLQDPTYFTDYPVLPDEVVDYLVAARVKLVGLDTCSADNQPGFPVHKKLLAAGIPIIENLTNLDQLTDKRFMLYALPLKLDLDGAPARVIAEVAA